MDVIKINNLHLDTDFVVVAQLLYKLGYVNPFVRLSNNENNYLRAANSFKPSNCLEEASLKRTI